jgi:pimeloyl-ACP methyl ester carboxylesterase
VNERRFDVDGVATRYFIDGNGPPVVLFHGGRPGSPYLAWGAQMWSGTMAALAHAFETIAFDRPGLGSSGAPPADDAYTLDYGAQHAASFLRALGKAPYHVVGHGEGGYVVTRLALDHPDLVRSCTIVAGGALAPGVSRNYVLADAPEPRLGRASQRWVLEAHAHRSAAAIDAWLDVATELAREPAYRGAVARMADGVEQRIFAPSLGRGRIAIYRELMHAGLAVPTFVIWGLHDPIAPLETARLLLEALARKQRRTEMRVINDAGHFVFLEQPAAFHRALSSFLQSSQ